MTTSNPAVRQAMNDALDAANARERVAQLSREVLGLRDHLASILSDIRAAEGQIARGKPDDARQMLANAVGHYLHCDWWGGKECSCGGMR